MNTHYDVQKLKEFLSQQDRHPLLNWAANETAGKLSKYRIRNLCLGRGKAPSQEAVTVLNDVIGIIKNLNY